MSSRGGFQSRGDVALRKLRSKNNHFAMTANKWMALGHSLFVKSESGQPNGYDASSATPREQFANAVGAILRTEERRDPEKIATIFCTELVESRKDIHALLRRFVPADMCEHLKPLDESSVPNDPVALLSKLREIQDGDEASVDRALFETIRALELGGEYFFLTTQVNGGKRNASVNEGRKRLHEFMELINGSAKLESRRVFIYLNERNDWRCTEVTLDEPPKGNRRGLVRLEHTVDIVTLPLFFGGQMQAIVEARQKDHLSAFARRFREPQAMLFESVSDMYGIRFAYFDKERMRATIKFLALRAALIQSDGSAKNVPPANRHSYKRLCIQSQYLYLNGKRREIQHMPARNLYSIEYSTGPENHDLYQKRWYTDPDHPGLFHHLFPLEIFGIDWNDPIIRKRMEDHIKERTLRKIEDQKS